MKYNMGLHCSALPDWLYNGYSQQQWMDGRLQRCTHTGISRQHPDT